MVISFSGRADGNCDDIMRFICEQMDDRGICFRNLKVHECSGCNYECFESACIYKDDDLFALFEQMKTSEKVVLIIPMYCGNPCSLYYKFLERSQGYFSLHEEAYERIISKLHIIGVCGSAVETPDYGKRLGDFWFSGRNRQDDVLLLERRKYGQRLEDKLLEVDEVKGLITEFVIRNINEVI